MILDAEDEELLKPGDVIIEATSGNTGIGAAMVGSVRNHDVIITIPKKMSQEKCSTIKALGATLFRVSDKARFFDEESTTQKAIKLHAEIPNSFILEQVIFNQY